MSSVIDVYIEIVYNTYEYLSRYFIAEVILAVLIYGVLIHNIWLYRRASAELSREIAAAVLLNFIPDTLKMRLLVSDKKYYLKVILIYSAIGVMAPIIYFFYYEN